MYADSREEVLQSEYLLGKILNKIKCSKDFVQASHVSELWRATSKLENVVSEFARHNKICFIGFVFEHGRPRDPEITLISPPAASSDDPAQPLRERFSTENLYGKYILGVYGGRVICRFESGHRKGKFYISSPQGTNPRLFRHVARPIAEMPKNPGDSRYGQFAVLGPMTGPASGFPVFFVKDPSREFFHDYFGAYFYTPGRVRVHICVFSENQWIPHEFDPVVDSKHLRFQRSPYSVQSGSKIYMMHLVKLIVWYDVAENVFGVVPLPTEMETTVKGCLQYTVGPHPEGELAVVSLNNKCLVRWVLTRTEDMVQWHEEARVDLLGAFGNVMTPNILHALSVEETEWQSIQVRAMSPDGHYVLVSVAISHGLFMVDMVEETVAPVPNLHKMGRVFPLSQYWPLKP